MCQTGAAAALSCAVSAPTVSLTRDMGTVQGADAPNDRAPIGVADPVGAA